MVIRFTIKFVHFIVYSVIILNSLVTFNMGCVSRYAPRGSQIRSSNVRQTRQNQEIVLEYGCTEDQFTCVSGTQCIPREFVCNGKYECDDESDELNFSCKHHANCPKGMFRCKYGGCIMDNLLCNNVKDCIDRSDEDARICSGVTPATMKTTPVSSGKPSKPTTLVTSTRMISSTIVGTTTPKSMKKPSQTGKGITSTTSRLVTPANLSPSTTTVSTTTEYKKCELPPEEADKSYLLYNSLYEPVTTNQTVPADYRLLFRCNDGFALKITGGDSEDYLQYYSNCTTNGIWDPPIKKCLKICKPINYPQNAVLECVFEGLQVNCSDALLAGTEITSRCNDLQFLPNSNSTSSLISCLENGEWDSIINDCASIPKLMDDFGNGIVTPDTPQPIRVDNQTKENNEVAGKLDGSNTILIAGYNMWVVLLVGSIIVITQVLCTVLIISKMIARLRARYNFS